MSAAQYDVYEVFQVYASEFEDVYNSIRFNTPVETASFMLAEVCKPFIDIVNQCLAVDMEYEPFEGLSVDDEISCINNFRDYVMTDVKAVKEACTDPSKKLIDVMRRAFDAYTFTYEVFRKWEYFTHGKFQNSHPKIKEIDFISLGFR